MNNLFISGKQVNKKSKGILVSVLPGRQQPKLVGLRGIAARLAPVVYAFALLALLETFYDLFVRFTLLSESFSAAGGRICRIGLLPSLFLRGDLKRLRGRVGIEGHDAGLGVDAQLVEVLMWFTESLDVDLMCSFEWLFLLLAVQANRLHFFSYLRSTDPFPLREALVSFEADLVPNLILILESMVDVLSRLLVFNLLSESQDEILL
jgi:hypothetical protein